MEVKILEDSQAYLHDNFNKGLLLQKWAWGEFKKTNNWKPIRLGVFKDKKLVYSIQLLVKPLPLGFSFIYSPFAKIPSKEIFPQLKKKIFEVALKEKSIFWTTEPMKKTGSNLLEEFGFIKSFQHVQPQNTSIINLAETEEDILRQMKQKGRYNIRLASKKEVYVKEIDSESELKDYQKAHEETSKRDKISARPFNYLLNLFHFLKKNNYGTALIAYYHNKPIAGAIISIVDDKAIYMYGASSNAYRNVMAPYLLQWEAIKLARRKKALTYDFYGIAPEDSSASHKWSGITRFKKQFGGESIKFIGSYDLVFKKTLYFIFKVVSKLRSF